MIENNYCECIYFKNNNFINNKDNISYLYYRVFTICIIDKKYTYGSNMKYV